MKDADDGGIFAGEHADDAAELAPVGSRRHELDEHLVACMAELISFGGMKMSSPARAPACFSIRTDETVAVAVQVEAPRRQGCRGLRWRWASPSGRGRA